MKKENIIIKKDTEKNWNKAKNFVPKQDEIIEYTDLLKPYNLKIGDGKTKLNDLPFIKNQYILDNDILIIL